MYVKMKIPIGEMAVVTDKKTRQSQFVDVDAIGLVSHVINHVSGVAHFTLAFGGVDSAGTFHLDPANSSNIANIVLDRNSKGHPEQRKTFDSLFRDDNGNNRCHYPRDFFEKLMEELLIPVAYKMIWGGEHRDMEVEMNGKLIFQPEHLKSKSA
jgi:hypothetical protein